MVVVNGYEIKPDADLQGADLRGADLQDADLRDANLRGANLDFASFPLSCGSFGMIADDRLVAQVFCHWARLNVSKCSPMVRYTHRVMLKMFGGFMTNLFCKYRDDIKRL